MTVIDMTAQLAAIVWGLQVMLAVSAAAIGSSVIASRLRTRFSALGGADLPVDDLTVSGSPTTQCC